MTSMAWNILKRGMRLCSRELKRRWQLSGLRLVTINDSAANVKLADTYEDISLAH